ncbi:hypothetical protein [Micrococcus luteus]|uniref:hypothetical protein n=1 Tax=Micrococcus luteus TaxID=1270 RepID=UPI0010C812BC|nr:hypothetical protein FDF08_10975 [Micrococcus luteus]
MTRRSGVDRNAIRRIARQIERDFNKEFERRPLRIPVEHEIAPGSPQPHPHVVNHYAGPVVTINGDHAQVAWNGGTNIGHREESQTVTPGFEQVAKVVSDVLAQADALELEEDERLELQQTGEEILTEVVKEEPDTGAIRRTLRTLKGFLAPALTAGASAAVSTEAQEAAQAAFDAIQALSF